MPIDARRLLTMTWANCSFITPALVMKLIFIRPPDVRNGWVCILLYYTLEVSKQLDRLIHEVVVCCLHRAMLFTFKSFEFKMVDFYIHGREAIPIHKHVHVRIYVYLFTGYLRPWLRPFARVDLMS